jgi:hypothetical protein
VFIPEHRRLQAAHEMENASMTNKPLNYSVGPATSVQDGGRHGRYVVTAEYVRGYQVLSFHETLRDARAAIKRYQAADARRAKAESEIEDTFSDSAWRHKP